MRKKENDLHPDRNQNRITPFFSVFFYLEKKKEKKQVLNYHVDFSLDSVCVKFSVWGSLDRLNFCVELRTCYPSNKMCVVPAASLSLK